jgi:hypothetical protein
LEKLPKAQGPVDRRITSRAFRLALGRLTRTGFDLRSARRTRRVGIRRPTVRGLDLPGSLNLSHARRTADAGIPLGLKTSMLAVWRTGLKELDTLAA